MLPFGRQNRWPFYATVNTVNTRQVSLALIPIPFPYPLTLLLSHTPHKLDDRQAAVTPTAFRPPSTKVAALVLLISDKGRQRRRLYPFDRVI